MTILTEHCSTLNLHSFYINIEFAIVFESQSLGYKLNPVSHEKISQTFVSNTEKIAWLIGEEILYLAFLSSHKNILWDWLCKPFELLFLIHNGIINHTS